MVVASIKDNGVFQVDQYQLRPIVRDTDYSRLRLKDHPYGQANNTTGDESNDGPGPFKKLYVKISKRDSS